AHCRQSSWGRNNSGASSWNIHLSSLSGAWGLAHGSAYETEIWPPLARLVSWAGPGRRSTTTTSWPAWRSHQALEMPMMPLPNTATFMRALLLAPPAAAGGPPAVAARSDRDVGAAVYCAARPSPMT